VPDSACGRKALRIIPIGSPAPWECDSSSAASPVELALRRP